MTPRPNSRRQRALDQLQIAADAIAKAITLLGGHTRALVPKRNKTTFVARKMLEGIDIRLNGVVGLVSIGDAPTPDYIIPITRGPEPPKPLREVVLRDDFEREYDATRRPQC